MSESARPPAAPPEPTPVEPAPAPPQTASLLQVAGAVFWSFLGIRKGRHMEQDTTTIKLHHVVLVGIAFAAVFVFSLIALVSYITRNAH
jgi:hypothetical protein